MLSRSPTPLVEAFLLLEQPRQRLSHWCKALAPLDGSRAPALASVAAYYDPTIDQAVLALRYDELALGNQRLAFVIEVALLAEIGMIQPAELSDGSRRRFLGERLSRCTISVADQRDVVGALVELVRRVRESKQSPAAHATVGPRGTTEDPVLLVTPKSTRDLEAISDDDVIPLVKSTRDEVTRRPRSRPPVDNLTASPATVAARPTSPNVIVRQPLVNRVATTPLAPIELQRLALAESSGALPTEAVIAARDAAPLPHGIIYARYLRSGRWVPVRIGALSLKGAALMSGVLPRLQDRVDVALLYAEHRAFVRGLVYKVSTAAEAALTGAPTFSVSFELDAPSRRQLTGLLTAARAANVTIKPPPPRQARRYPVEWPVCLGTMRGAVRGEALDVSRDGMFVRPTNALALDASLSFSATLDDNHGPIAGRAQVVRHIDAGQAQDCGLAPGYGLHIVDMGRADYQRWRDFLLRIEQRVAKSVLIGANAARLAELQAVLAAAGYLVSGSSDPDELARLAGGEGASIDACILDAGWLSPATSATWAEGLVARNVPCVTIHGDPRRVRAAIDRALAVV